MVTSKGGACLLDCGATALIAMRRFAIDPGQINAIFLSHLHGDHFAGVSVSVARAAFHQRGATNLF